MDVLVVIPIFGDSDYWTPLAERARKSIPHSIHSTIVNSESLFTSRRIGVTIRKSEWLCFLDADDELTPGYFDTMKEYEQRADVICPSYRNIEPGKLVGSGYSIPEGNLLERNFCVISSPIRRSFFEKVGGFRDLDFYEDWDLFIRLKIIGARFSLCPEAILNVHQRPGSRNKVTPEQHSERVREFQEVYK